MVAALNLRGRWAFKEWGIGFTWIMWQMNWNRGTFSLKGPTNEVRRRSLLIKTNEGILHKIGVTCEDVDRFLNEVEKMGVNIVRATDKGSSDMD
jgi:hypothetical protein